MKKRIIALFIAVLFVISLVPVTAFAGEVSENEPYEISELDDNYEGYTPIPLLIVVINFDANGNGKDDALAGMSTTDRSSSAYGEQWAYSPESYWGQEVFGTTGKTLSNYYSEMSSGNFTFTPAEETYGIKNNGVVYATVNMQHPHASSGSSTSQYGAERLEAIKDIDKYIDFASYDTNGDGMISFTELSFVFIIAGYNSKWGTAGKTDKQVWGMNCFEVSSSSWSTKNDGVVVLNGSVGGSFCYVGEYMSQNQPIRFGTIAHELGHVLGAKDLYTYSGYTWCGSPGELALQGSGSSICRPGEQSGQSPSAIDPYYLLDFGFQKATVVNDGTYTLYSRDSSKGEYNIIRINTANEKEYYLIENRYSVLSGSYDGIKDGSKGIIVWHIDESVMDNYTLPDCWKGTPHAPGDTPLSPGGNGKVTVGNNENAWDKSDGTFIARNCTFSGSDTWTTLMTEEEAKDFDLQIEFLSAPGNEMQIKVTGTLALAPSVYSAIKEATTNTLTLGGKINDLNCGTLTQLKASISSTDDFKKVIKEVYLKPESDGTYSYVFEGLTEKSTYFVKIEATGSNGTATKVIRSYTKAIPKVRTTDYIVYLYKGLTTANKTYEMVVKCGETLKYSFPMSKSLEKFGGWYLDPDYTQRYDMAFTKTTCEEMYLYARWIVNENAITLKIVGATPLYEVFAIKTGENFTEPELAEVQGQTFEGWYSDPEFTTKFNFDDSIDEAGEVTVYAKYSAKQAETTSQTQSTETTAPVETTTSTTEKQGESKNNSTVVIIIVAVAVVAIAAIAFVLIKKKKN